MSSTATAGATLRPAGEPVPARDGALPRPRVAGKFFVAGGEKLYVKAVGYGPFRPGPDGAPFPSIERARRDFELMRELGANAFRTFTPPPAWLLDLAAEHGLRVLVGVPWAQQVCFLDDPEIVRDSRRRIARAALEVGSHPAVLAVFIGNETPPDVVRWHGAERVQRFLRSLYDEAKAAAPETLVSYANFPPTEYLDLDFIDFVSFNVYLHHEPEFRRYLMRLQNLAEDRPLFVSELGMDSIREGREQQAATLGWQVRAAFELGVAGVSVFSWTDDWFALSWQTGGGFQVEDWAFGVVDAERRPKPAFAAVRETFTGPLPPPLPDPPTISVVVCAYDAERTLAACLESLRDCAYPSYEVIVVNDGSTDATGEIAHRYEGDRIRVIDQPNRGLSAARNVGLAAARGEIVAYTDSDCVVDRDWLTYLAYKLREGFVAVGGPNFPPPEDALVPSAVAVAPGGPTHVLMNDDVAEHIPGCNMAFVKPKLQEIGGFDVAFTAAGDDVDLCWRLQNAGYTIGFSPAAVVWHFRRNTVRAYLKQQMGYGKAEALLFFKHPLRFNALGQSRWLGRIYGDLATTFLPRRPVIYHGTFGDGLFQTLYERPASVLTHLPFTLEWNLLAAVLLITALLSGEYLLVSSLPLAISILSAASTAARAPLDPRFRGLRARLLVMALLYLGPLVRSFERYVWRMRGTKDAGSIEPGASLEPSNVSWLERRFELALWSETGCEKRDFLHELMSFLALRRYRIAVDSGWNDWDIEVSRGVWTSARIAVAVENHTGAKRLLRVRTTLHTAPASIGVLLACVGAALLGVVVESPELARLGLGLALLDGGTIAYRELRVARVLLRVFAAVASRLGLTRVGGRRERTA